ncbi:MAG: S1 RNA-binding domain-containing protein [Eubacterium sp.]|nr:S1 RNA-binding domain-containing protein [Eubacterium sp.]
MTTEQLLLGRSAELTMLRQSRFGVYLTSQSDPGFEVLLPNNQVPKNMQKGDKIEVFLYKDSEDRLIATTTCPHLKMGQVGALTVKDVTKIGAFLDWGLAKDLFLPFKEQTSRVRPGDKALVTLYLDKSDRLCASMHVYDFLSCDSPYQKGDHVEGFVYEITDSFGTFVAVDQTYSALLPHNEMTRDLKVGQTIQARVKEVTEEGKLTLSLQEKVKVQMGLDAEKILTRLEESGGSLPFHDKTAPEIIKREFQMSKAAFKRAIGRLLKEKKIELIDGGIRLK